MNTMQLSSLLQNAPDPIVIHTDAKVRWVNTACCRLLGIESVSEVIDTPVLKWVPDDFKEFCSERINRVLENKITTPVDEYKILRRDGSEVWVESKSVPATFEGKPGAIIFIRDISQRREAERVLNESEERMRFALDASNISVWEYNVGEKTITRSLLHDTIFGFEHPPGHRSLKTYFSLVHPADRELVKKTIKDALRAEKEWDIEIRIQRSDGEQRWLLLAGKSVPGMDGTIQRLIGTVKDITPRKHAREVLSNNYSLLNIAAKIAEFGGWDIDLKDALENQSSATVNWSGKIAEILEMPTGHKPTIKESLEFVLPEYREQVIKSFRQCALQGIPYDIEIKNKTRSGKIKWIKIIGEPIYEQGKIVKVHGAFQDITKAKKAEEKLIGSKEKFRSLFEDHVAVKLIIDPVNGAIVDANESAARYYGWSIQQLRQMNITQINILPPDILFHEMSRALAEGNILFNFQHKNARGEVHDAEVFTSRIVIGNRELLHSIVVDVERRNTTRKRLNLLGRSIEQSPVSIMITSRDGKIQYVNPSFEATSGYSLSELRDKTPAVLKSGFHNRQFYHNMWQSIISGKEWSGEMMNKKKNGDLYWERVAISPIADEKGLIVNFVSVREDITERKKILKNLTVAKEKAEESDRLKMAFLANISHEIRTPMNGIMGFANILKNDELNTEDHLKFLDIIEKSGQRMLDTINDLIDIAEIESGQVTLHSNICNVNDVLTTLIDFFQPQAMEKNLQLLLTEPVPHHLAVINTDHSKLNSVLTNLIRNAIKFTTNGKIEVGCRMVKGMLEFMVRDTGIGIPQSRQEDIFIRFEQADMEEARRYQGSGLGLAIAKAYVEMMGGLIWVKSKPGAGSVFRFTLPVLPLKSKKPVTTDNQSSETQDNTPDFTGKSILLVEDDLYSREMISYLLRKAGAHLMIATDGLDWVQQFDTGKVDLVLLDIQLPKLDGYTILKLIRSKNKNVPVIAQTAYAMPDDIIRLKDAGFTDCITKPLNPDIMYQTLVRHLEITPHSIK